MGWEWEGMGIPPWEWYGKLGMGISEKMKGEWE